MKKMLLVMFLFVTTMGVSELCAQEDSSPVKITVRRYKCLTKAMWAGEEITLSRPLQTNEMLQFRAQSQFGVLWIDVPPTLSMMSGRTNIFRMVGASTPPTVYRVETNRYPQDSWSFEQTPVTLDETHVFQSGARRFYVLLLSRWPHPKDIISFSPAPNNEAILTWRNLYKGSDLYAVAVKTTVRGPKLSFRINDPELMTTE